MICVQLVTQPHSSSDLSRSCKWHTELFSSFPIIDEDLDPESEEDLDHRHATTAAGTATRTGQRNPPILHIHP